jgi:integrase
MVSDERRPRRFTLGRADEINLADARERALEIRAQARVGVDAVVVKHAAESQKARPVGETFADRTARCLESAARGDGMKRGEALAPRTLDEYGRVLKTDVLPARGGIAPGEVTKAHVGALVDSIHAEGHTVRANRGPRRPLSTGAMKVVAGIKRAESPYVFPAPTRAGYVDHPQKAVLKIRERLGVSDFRLHTLRTTVRTRLSELRTPGGSSPPIGA